MSKVNFESTFPEMGEYSAKSAPSNASQRTREIQSAPSSEQQVENIRSPASGTPRACASLHLSIDVFEKDLGARL